MKKSVALVLPLAAMLFVACAKNDSSNPGAEPHVYYHETETQTSVRQVSNELGILVVLRNSKDFANEYSYKRVLVQLLKNKGVIAQRKSEIEQIVIDGATNIQENAGRFIVHLGFDISDTDMTTLFTHDFDRYKKAYERARELSNVIGVRVVDQIGFSGQELKNMVTKLRSIAREVDFSQDRTFTTLVLSDMTGITANGMIINIRASEASIVLEMKRALDARINWNNDVSRVLSSLGLNLTFQTGVFTGAELNEAIAMIKRNAVTIKSLSRRFTTFIIGKRWDTDLSTNTMLINYLSSEETVRERILKEEPKVSEIDFEVAETNLTNVFAARGFRMEKIQIDLPKTAESLNLIKDFTAVVAANVKIDLLRQLDVRVLRLNTLEKTAFVQGSKTLHVRLPSTILEVDGVLSAEAIRVVFDSVLEDIRVSAATLKVFTQVNGLMPSAISNDRLISVKKWFMTDMNEQIVTTTKLASMTIVSVENGGSPTSYANGSLIINLVDFNPAKMKAILKY